MVLIKEIEISKLKIVEHVFVRKQKQISNQSKSMPPGYTFLKDLIKKIIV